MSNGSMVMQVAAAVADQIAALTLPQTVTPELTPVPSLEFKELKSLKVLVCPRSRKSTLIARNLSDKVYEIDVAIVKKIAMDDLDSMLQLVEAIEAGVEGKTLTALPSVRCVDVANEPVYAPEHLRMRQQFTSILTLTCKGS